MSTLDELIMELDDIYNIVSNKDGRALSDVQRTIMMKSRSFSIKALMNKIMLDTETDVETKITNSIKLVQKVKKILSFEPNDHDLIYWYELHIFHRMMIASVVQANGQAGKLGLIGIAHTLSELLLGVNAKNTERLFVEKNHPEYVQRTMVAYNLANADAVIYGSLLHLLPFINEMEAFSYIEKLMSAFVTLDRISREAWDTEKFLEAKVSIANLNERVQGAVVVTLAPSTIAISLYNIFNKFSKGIPEHLYREEILTGGSAREVVDTSLRFFDQSFSMMQDIILHTKQSSRYANFDVMTAPITQMFFFQYNNARILTECFSELLRYEETRDRSGFDEKAMKILALLESYKPYFSNVQFLKSSMGEAMDSYLAYYIPLVTEYILESGALDVLTQFKNSLGVFLENQGMNYFPRSSLNYMISYITILLKYNIELFELELDSILEHLSSLQELLVFFPKELAATSILECLLRYVNGEEVDTSTITSATEAITEATGKTLKITEYVEYLVSRLAGKDVEFDNDIHQKKWLFDAYSYIYPDFSEIMRKNGKPEIVYYPVNLWQDAIIKN